MTWKLLGNIVVNHTWQLLPNSNGNLIKITHATNIGIEDYWDYKGLIGRCLGTSIADGLGEIRRFLAHPQYQYFLFPPLPDEISNSFAIKGPGNIDWQYNWYLVAWVWSEKIFNSNNNFSNIENQNELQLSLLNTLNLKSDQIITDINSLAITGGYGANGTTPNGNGGGNPNLNF